MKPRLFIIFALIVILPTITIIFLGINLSRSEEQAVKEQFREVLMQRLSDLETNISKVIREREQQLLPMTEDLNPQPAELRQIVNANPLINQIFIINRKRALIYPAPGNPSLTNQERDFLLRSSEIWTSGETFYHPSELLPEDPSQDNGINTDQRTR